MFSQKETINLYTCLLLIVNNVTFILDNAFLITLVSELSYYETITILYNNVFAAVSN